MAPQLPAHLSYKFALALLPPEAISPPIEAVRRVHDRHFARWPPHINLLYPFLSSPLPLDLQSRLQRAVRPVQPFNISFAAGAPATFHHSKKSKTVWLGPATQSVQQLQEALQAEFSECNADLRPYIPHLSLGQARNDQDAQQVAHAIGHSVAAFHNASSSAEAPTSLEWAVDRVFVLERKGFHDRFKVVGMVQLGMS